MARGLPDGPVPPQKLQSTYYSQILKSCGSSSNSSSSSSSSSSSCVRQAGLAGRARAGRPAVRRPPESAVARPGIGS
eukprot:10271606-Heterocapsa_arctica.AAC.1